jgi:hypothetical protein
LTLLVLLGIGMAPADDGVSADAFSEQAKSEFNSLLRSAAPDRRGFWQSRYQKAFETFLAKSRELQSTSEMLSRQTNGKELTSVFAYEYLNTIRELQLKQNTMLVEDLGRELLNAKADRQIIPLVASIEAQIAAMAGKPEHRNLQGTIVSFRESKRAISGLEGSTPIKARYLFEPRANAYASPERKTEYIIHDWNASILAVDQLLPSLQSIEDQLKSASFFDPKDPLPWLPLLTQITFLFVAMGGWIKSYHSDKAFLTIGLLVIPSMFASVVLVLYSQDTFLNIARQSLVPGGFILFWIAKNKKWFKLVSVRLARSGPVQPKADQEDACPPNPSKTE